MKRAMSKKVIALVMVASVMGTTVVSAADVKKDESVYVNLNSDGSYEKSTVSNWLHSNQSNITVDDQTELKNIVNVKSDEEPKTNGDKLTWNMEGSDLYYQGTTDKEIPLDVSIKYYYEGKEIEPDDIAGKSGKIKIEIEVTNKSYKEVDINGKTRKIYTPFVTAGEVTLPNDKFECVTVDNGTMLSEGNNTIVAFATFPGLKESLDLDAIPFDNVELKNKVTIEADADKFSMGPIMITATPSIDKLNNLDGAVDLSEYKDKLNQLKDNYDKLLAGETQINDGIQGGYSQLQNGLAELRTPKMQEKINLLTVDRNVQLERTLINDAYYAKNLNLDSVKPYMSMLNENTLNTAKTALSAGKQVAGNYETIKTATSSVNSLLTNTTAMQGLGTLQTDLSTLQADYKALSPDTQKALKGVMDLITPENLAAIQKAETELNGAQKQLLQAVKDAGGQQAFVKNLHDSLVTLQKLSKIDTATMGSDITSYGYAYLILKADLAATYQTAYKTVLQATGNETQAKTQAAAEVQKEKDKYTAEIDGVIAPTDADSAQAMKEEIKNLRFDDIADSATTLKGYQTTLTSLATGVSQLKSVSTYVDQAVAATDYNNADAMQKLNNTFAILTGQDENVQALNKTLNAVMTLPADQQKLLFKSKSDLDALTNDLNSNMNTINQIQTMLNGLTGGKGITADDIQKFNNFNTMVQNSQGLVNQLNNINLDNINTATVNQLNTVSNNLMSMQNDLKNSEDILRILNESLQSNNVDQARNLISTLPALTSKLQLLYNGSATLASGMQQYGEQGINVIYDKGTGAMTAVDELKASKDALVDASNEFGCFSGKSENMDSSSKFIMKTAEIKYEEPEDTSNKKEEKKETGFWAWLKGLIGLD